ncbi:alpha-hydroxy-acid oxidizing protein [Microbulbifer sp. GL-2]|uniref:alpha-hydroxy-acid oxidizing protein n=1 Tax=Microbulbifer sp. GL-2 TaxID=2591606 RepID=UPI0011807645
MKIVLRSGADAASVLALGPQFSFLGRCFMYSNCVPDQERTNHTIYLLKTWLTQVIQKV